MTNRPKKKGTAFETKCVDFLRERLDDDRIERRALHGSLDMGDLYGIWAHGLAGIAECKDYASWSDADLEHWQDETLRERGNADADFALLIVHRTGCGAKRFHLNHVWLTLGDFLRIDGHKDFSDQYNVDLRDDVWVCITLEDACRCMEGRGIEL